MYTRTYQPAYSLSFHGTPSPPTPPVRLDPPIRNFVELGGNLHPTTEVYGPFLIPNPRPPPPSPRTPRSGTLHRTCAPSPLMQTKEKWQLCGTISTPAGQWATQECYMRGHPPPPLNRLHRADTPLTSHTRRTLSTAQGTAVLEQRDVVCLHGTQPVMDSPSGRRLTGHRTGPLGR